MGLQTQLNVVNDARARTKDSHAFQMRHLYKTVLGEEAPPMASGDDMAGISVQGDTIYNVAAPPTVEPPASPQQTSTLAKVGTAATLLAAGAGLSLAGIVGASLLKDDPPAAVAPLNPQPTTPIVDRDTYLPYEFSIE